MPTGISLLREVTATITPIGDDKGATVTNDWSDPSSWPVSPGPTTLSVDRLRVASSRRLVDHSTAQQEIEANREAKGTWTINIDTKLFRDGADLTYLTDSKCIVGIKVTSEKASFSTIGIIESFDVAYDTPSTLSAVIRSFGYPITWDTATEFPDP